MTRYTFLFSSSSCVCRPSVAPAITDSSSTCLNLKCMVNIISNASDTEGKGEYFSSKTRASSPVSVPPKHTAFSPCLVPARQPDHVSPVALRRVPGSALPLSQYISAASSSSSSSPTNGHQSTPASLPNPLPLPPDLNHSQVSVGAKEGEKGQDRERSYR